MLFTMQTTALTHEDIHGWKKFLESVKSSELSLDERTKLEEINRTLHKYIRSQKADNARLIDSLEKTKSAMENGDVYQAILLRTELKALKSGNQKLRDIAETSYKRVRHFLVKSSLNGYDPKKLRPHSLDISQKERLTKLDNSVDLESLVYVDTLIEAMTHEMRYSRYPRNLFFYQPPGSKREPNEYDIRTANVLTNDGQTLNTQTVSFGNLISFTKNKFITYDSTIGMFRELEAQPNAKALSKVKSVPTAAMLKTVFIPVSLRADAFAKSVKESSTHPKVLVDTKKENPLKLQTKNTILWLILLALIILIGIQLRPKR